MTGLVAPPVRRPRRSDGGDADHPGDRALRDRADGPDADRSDPRPTRLRAARSRSSKATRRPSSCVEFYGESETELAPKCDDLDRTSCRAIASGLSADPHRCSRPQAAGRHLEGAQGRTRAADEHARRRQADPLHRGRLGAGRAPAPSSSAPRGDGRRARHDRRLLRPRLGRLPAHPPADQSQGASAASRS